MEKHNAVAAEQSGLLCAALTEKVDFFWTKPGKRSFATVFHYEGAPGKRYILESVPNLHIQTRKPSKDERREASLKQSSLYVSSRQKQQVKTKTADFDWLKLPKTITTHIFSFLPFTEVCSTIRLVCHTWNNIVQSESSTLIDRSGWLNFSRDENEKRHVRDQEMNNFQMSFDLSNIRGISFRNQVSITDSGLRSCILLSPFISSVILSGCISITNFVFLTIGKLKHLRHLDISYCTQLTDCAIKMLFLGAITCTPRISSINLSGCEQISDESFNLIGEKIGDSLVKLCARGLPHVTDVGVEQLTRNTVKLSVVNLSFCPKLTDISCLFLLSTLVQDVCMDGCALSTGGLKQMSYYQEVSGHSFCSV